MNARSFFIICAQLLGIWLFIEALSEIPMAFERDLAGFTRIADANLFRVEEVLLKAGLSFVLIVGSRRIATLLGYSATETSVELKQEEIIQAGLSVFGLLWLFPMLLQIGTIAYTYRHGARPIPWAPIISASLILVIALIVIFGAAKIARWAVRVRR